MEVDENTTRPCERQIRPVRIVICVWGEKYVGEFMDYALPALLAPGNLPALSEVFECEFVLLTESRLFPLVTGYMNYSRARQYCNFRLVSIDDLVVTTSFYGNSLTHAYHRGFADLDDGTNVLFFNADWILADGSLRSLIDPMLEGRRLIVSPSYCVNTEDVRPLLERQIAGQDGILAIGNREMADLAIRNRHNTIRAKTINQSAFHMDVPDQFYFKFDDTTFFCRQMPIGIVMMRPERRLERLETFWDYGTIAELCPTIEPLVLGDSDAFLMIELRSTETYSGGLRFGPLERDRIIAGLSSFVTKDHHDYGRHTLVLHSQDLTPEATRSAQEFGAFVDGILDELPPPERHVYHPFWGQIAPFYDTVEKAYREAIAAGKSGAPMPRLDFYSLLKEEVAGIERDVETARATATLPNPPDAYELRLNRAGHFTMVLESVYARNVDEMRATIRRIARHERHAAVAIERLAKFRAGDADALTHSGQVTRARFEGSTLRHLMSAEKGGWTGLLDDRFTEIKPLLNVLNGLTLNESDRILIVPGGRPEVYPLLNMLPGNHYVCGFEGLVNGLIAAGRFENLKFELIFFDISFDEAVDCPAVQRFLRAARTSDTTTVVFAKNGFGFPSRFGLDISSDAPIVYGLLAQSEDVEVYFTGGRALLWFASNRRRIGELAEWIFGRNGLGRIAGRIARQFAHAAAYLSEGRKPVVAGPPPERVVSAVVRLRR